MKKYCDFEAEAHIQEAPPLVYAGEIWDKRFSGGVVCGIMYKSNEQCETECGKIFVVPARKKIFPHSVS